MVNMSNFGFPLLLVERFSICLITEVDKCMAYCDQVLISSKEVCIVGPLAINASKLLPSAPLSRCQVTVALWGLGTRVLTLPRSCRLCGSLRVAASIIQAT
jgi:hypothetical protein